MEDIYRDNGFDPKVDFIMTDKKIIFTLDEDNELIMLYDLGMGGDLICKRNEGALRIVCPEIGQKVEEHFKIDLKDYGVEVKEEVISLEDMIA